MAWGDKATCHASGALWDEGPFMSDCCAIRHLLLTLLSRVAIPFVGNRLADVCGRFCVYKYELVVSPQHATEGRNIHMIIHKTCLGFTRLTQCGSAENWMVRMVTGDMKRTTAYIGKTSRREEWRKQPTHIITCNYISTQRLGIMVWKVAYGKTN